MKVTDQYNRSIIEAILDLFVAIEPNGIITDVNNATEKAIGIKRDKLIGTSFSLYFTEPDKAEEGYQLVLKDGKVFDYELNLVHISGKITPVFYNATVYQDHEGKVAGIFAIARDVSTIRKYENELIYLKNNLEQLAEQKAAELVVANRELMFQAKEKADRAAELLVANKELTYQSGEKADRAAELIIANKKLAIQRIEKADRAAELLIANKELTYQSGEKADRAAELIIANKELAIQSIEKANRAAELLVANKELIYQSGEKADRAAELVIANKELAIQSIEKADRAAELLIANKELTDQSVEMADRAAELLIANKELAIQSIERADRAAELLIANKELTYQSGEKADRAAELLIANKELAFQHKEKADRAAELLIANKELSFQNKEKDKRATELIITNRELLFQMAKRRASEEKLMHQKIDLENSNNRLIQMLKQSINAISKIGQLRDAYTAIHQKKVAELAIAIAREMGFTDEAILNISYGAQIHDIGKIYIASDILNKPGKITDLEYQILQTHVEHSYEVVKEIDFSPQIPIMIYQHHERLDGSGYPKGLTGNHIIIESRILATADVVEAMSAHRPYRASLGIDAALEEISKNKGSKYDKTVVEVCTKLFRKKGFKFTCE